MSLRIKRDSGNDNRYQYSKRKYRKMRLCTLQFFKSLLYYNTIMFHLTVLSCIVSLILCHFILIIIENPFKLLSISFHDKSGLRRQ